MGKGRERQIILKTDKRTIFVEMRPGRMLQAKSSGWDEDRLFLECGKREVAVKTARGVMAPSAHRAAAGRDYCPTGWWRVTVTA
jgi:hypothetical protein